MANLITPITLIPRNALTGVASDYMGTDPITVVIGNNTTEDLYFRGTYYKRPSETYIGLDINKYIKDLCKLDAVKPYQTTYENEITDFIKFYRVKMYDSSSTEIFDFSGYVFAGAPMLGDIIRVFDGLFIGAYREYMESNETGLFLKNDFSSGDVDDPEWTIDKDTDVVTQFITSFYYVGVAQNKFGNCKFFLDESFASAATYSVKVQIAFYKLDHTVKIFGVDITDQVPNELTVFPQYVTIQVAGTVDTSVVPAIEIDFPDSSSAQRDVRIRLVEITAYQATWENGTQYDLLLHNRIYTFDNLTAKSPTGVTWNKALVGAPVGVSLWNPTDADRSLKASVEYYKADLTVDKSQDLPITYPDFFAKKTYGLFQNDNTYQRSAFRLALDDQTDVRAVFIERITPCFDRNYYQVYYINRLGGLDWLIMTGKNYRRTQNEKKAYQIDNGEFSGGEFQYSTANLTKRNYLIEGKEIFELNSDIENENEYKWLEELVSSPAVWVWDYNTKLLQAVDVTDNNFEFKNHWNNQVFNFKLNCETLNNSFR
jgi:hypothetical protein